MRSDIFVKAVWKSVGMKPVKDTPELFRDTVDATLKAVAEMITERIYSRDYKWPTDKALNDLRRDLESLVNKEAKP